MALMTLTKENFDATVAQNEIVLVDFWAAWCGPCKTFAKTYEAVAAEYPNIIFGKINVDEEPTLASDFVVRSIPTVLIMRQSIAVFYQAGVLPAAALRDLITQAQALDMDEVRKQAAESK